MMYDDPGVWLTWQHELEEDQMESEDAELNVFCRTDLLCTAQEQKEVREAEETA